MPERTAVRLVLAALATAALLLVACSDSGGEPLGPVAFVRDGDLWVAGTDGSDGRKLVDADSLDLGDVSSPKPASASASAPYIERPEWSADGEWLSFAVPRPVKEPWGPWFYLFVVRRDGSGLSSPWSEDVRSYEPGFYGVRDWRWSPVGAELATAVFGAPAGSFYIRVFDPVKQDDAWPLVPQTLTSGFEWLLDGSQIAVNFGGGPFDPSPVQNYRLVLYGRTDSPGAPYTGQEEPVYEYQGSFTSPRLHSVAPDGSRILLWDIPTTSTPSAQPLSVVSLDGTGGKVHIADTYHVTDWAAVWSPDSSAIAVIQGGERMGWRGRRLVVATPEGGRLLDNGGEEMSDSHPAWSPDASRVALVRAPERPENAGLGDGHIWITPRQGPPVQVTDDPAYTERYPQWSPDGASILFVRLPADAVERETVAPELWAMSPDGANQRKLLELGEMPGTTALMTDDWGDSFDWKPIGEKPTGEPSPTATPPTPSPSPEAPELRQGDQAEFPSDMAMIIETGCWACSGGPDVLLRYYRNSSGQVQQETLLSAEKLNLPTRIHDTGEGPHEHSAFIGGLAMEPTASIMAVSYCVQGDCGPGGEWSWSADSLSVIFVSTDGGVTWRELTRGGPALNVVDVFTDGRVLTVSYTENLGPPHYAIIPGNVPVYPPERGVRPFTASDQVLWVTDDGALLLSDGREFYRQEGGSLDVYHQEFLGEFSGDLEKGSALVSWALPAGRELYALTVLDVNEGKTSVVKEFRAGRAPHLGYWSPKDMRAVISVVPERPFDDSGPPLPALLDLTTGEYQPIPGPFISADEPYRQTGRTIVDAVQFGPFARVVNTGSCLNIRDAPSLDSNVLTCAADRVLLRIDSAAPPAPGWLTVTTPSGMHGYASTQYMEIPFP